MDPWMHGSAAGAAAGAAASAGTVCAYHVIIGPLYVRGEVHTVAAEAATPAAAPAAALAAAPAAEPCIHAPISFVINHQNKKSSIGQNVARIARTFTTCNRRLTE